MTGLQIALLIVGVVVAWLLFWVSLVMLIARFGGWRKLATAYPADRVLYEGRRFRWQTFGLKRWVSYNRCVNVTVKRDGLLFAVVAFFRPGHAPILLPWSEFDVSYEKRWIVSVAVLRPKRAPDVPITILKSLAERIADEAGDRWPAPASPPATLSEAPRS